MKREYCDYCGIKEADYYMYQMFTIGHSGIKIGKPKVVCHQHLEHAIMQWIDYKHSVHIETIRRD